MPHRSSAPHRTAGHRFRGERGVTIIMTALVLVPLMVFAAYGVDLAGFYSRVGQLQRAADAAALAGTVWMPDYDKARTEAAASLAKNGFVHGTDGIVVTYAPGSKLNSLLVTVEDTSVTTYFSKVIGHRQAIARSAEAQYNLPIPLGSPLNYFGGDRSKTQPDPVFTVSWPNPYDDEGDWPPAGPGGNCNVGTTAAQDLGGWRGNDYRSGDWNQSGPTTPRCLWSARVTGSTPITDTTPPAGHFLVTPPDVVQCEIDFGWGSSYWGRYTSTGIWDVTSPDPFPNWTACTWGGSTTPPNPLPNNHTADSDGCNVMIGGTFSGRYTRFGSWSRTQASAPDCTWVVGMTPGTTVASSLPPFYQSRAPENPWCNVGAEATYGQWQTSAGWGPGYTAGRPLCQWPAEVVDSTPPNPIPAGHDPRFWAAIGGPGDVAAYGDAYSARCTTSLNCSNVQNQNHTDSGYWYVIRMPESGAAASTLKVFDAAYNPDGGSNSNYGTGDVRGSFSGSNGFTTTYTVYRQRNALDFSDREPVPGCNPLSVRNEAAYRFTWHDLCSLPGTPGALYQLNVKTSSTSSDADGVNGYAVWADAHDNGVDDLGVEPALYAYSSMGMRNNISSGGTAEFYLAEVGPQYAGKSLVIELFDAGDASAAAYLRPVAPGSAPASFTDIAASRCRYTSSPEPNSPQSSSPGGATSPSVTTPTQPGSNCEIQTTSNGGTGQFNDSWLRIVVSIPADYTCTLGVNPVTTGGSCWWGIKYRFVGDANDVTTWRARIEGNPVHLTD